MLIVRLKADSLLGYLGGNHMGFESLVHISIIIDKGLGIACW